MKPLEILNLHDPDHVKYDVIHLVQFGSRAYGTETPTSDYDYRGVFLPRNFNELISLYDPKDNYKFEGETADGKYDIELWSLKKFLKLLAKSNPNAIEIAYGPSVIPNASYRVLSNQLAKFPLVTKELARTFGGYAHGQLRLSEKAWVATGKMDWKNCMHLVRLVMMAENALSTGAFKIRLPPDEVEFLQNIRYGKVAKEIVWGIGKAGLTRMDDLAKQSKLPEAVDHVALDNLYTEMVQSYYGVGDCH